MLNVSEAGSGAGDEIMISLESGSHTESKNIYIMSVCSDLLRV